MINKTIMDFVKEVGFAGVTVYSESGSQIDEITTNAMEITVGNDAIYIDFDFGSKTVNITNETVVERSEGVLSIINGEQDRVDIEVI